MPVVHRSNPSHTLAAALNLFASLFTIVFSLPIMQDGAAASDEVPYPIIILGFVLGILGIVSSYGVWQGQRWGVVLTIVLNVVSLLSGAPGIIFGPNAFLVISSVIGCLLNIAIVYLLLRRSPAAASASAPSDGVQA